MRTRTSIIAVSVTVLGVVAGTIENIRADDGALTVIPQASGTPRPVPIQVPASVSPLPVRQYQQPFAADAYVGQPVDAYQAYPQQETCDGYCSPGLPLGALLHCNCLHCLLQRKQKGCNRSPDYGWSPPTETPIVRVPVQYQRYWPNRWTGERHSANEQPAPRFPTVFMPTDTAQLGYYYHRVPQWSGVNAAPPPEPWPAHWHCRDCPTTQQTTYRRPIGVRPATSTELPNHPNLMPSPAPIQQQPQPAHGTVPPAPAPVFR